jgi:hypothetical protein
VKRIAVVALLAGCGATPVRSVVVAHHADATGAFEPCTITGVVRDVTTAEGIDGATIVIEGSPGAIADEHGAFTVALAEPPRTLHVWYGDSDLVRDASATRCGAELVLRVRLGPRRFHGCELMSDLLWAD